jgi:hypothetical protein
VYRIGPGKTNILAAIEETIDSSDSVPVCLAWRENPYRLVSLWEIVKPFPAHLFLTEVRMLESTLGTSPYLDEVGYERKVKMQTLFTDAVADCAKFGLVASRVSAEKLLALVSQKHCPSKRLRELVQEYQERLIDEMSAPRFFSLTDEEATYYMNSTQGWKDVIERFPAAITDIEEMNKCFALSRYAAAVFHSVQAIECGLLEFGKFINVNDPKSGWTAVTGKLTILITKTKYTDLEPLYQEHFAFLEQMHGVVAALNSAWRNKISHAQGRLALMTSEFSPEVAEEIIIVSRSFMRRLATELPS